MSDGTITLVVYGVLLAALLAFLCAIALRFFARPLSFNQAFLISFLASAVGVLLVMIYYAAKRSLGLPNGVDAVAGVAMLLLIGALITQRARAYGISKTGLLGVGAKSVIGMVVLTWAPVFILLSLGVL